MEVMTSGALALLGAALCLGLARGLRGGHRLTVILLGAFAIRALLAVGLYTVSAHHLPVFASLHLPGGFWALAPDAEMYHANAVRIAAAITGGTSFPVLTTREGIPVGEPAGFFYYVGFLYRFLGPCPLYVPLLNASLGAATAAVTYALARRMADRTAAEVAALVVGFWPSGVLWSSQVLKDPLVTFLAIGSLDLVVRVWAARPAAVLPLAGLLAATIALLADNRPYTAAVLPGVLALALFGGVLVATRSIRWERLVRGAVLLLLVCIPAGAFLGTPSRPASQGARAPGPAPGAPPPRIEPGVGIVHVALSPVQALDRTRRALLQSGGASAFGTDVRFARGWDVVAFLPSAMTHALFYPFPWHWRQSGSTGGFRALAGMESVAILVLMPLFALAVSDAVRTPSLDAWLLLLYGVLLLVGLALVVPNAGTLFRLRLQAVIPLLVLVADRAARLGADRRSRPGPVPASALQPESRPSDPSRSRPVDTPGQAPAASPDA